LAFAILGTSSALLFAISYWQDYEREWRAYQKQYGTELRAILSGSGKQDLPDPGFVYMQTLVSSTRVDRCQMCHRGIDDPRFAKSPQPIAAHPKIPSHPFEKFGCTVCHMGQGRATTVADAHGKVPFWEEPLLSKPYIQAKCGTCHRGVKLKGAPLVEKGRQLYLQMGCIGCHRIHGVGGTVGPDLTWVGERRKDPKWHLAHFKNPQSVSAGTTMPPYGHLKKEGLDALTVYMMSLKHAPAGLIAGPNVGASGK
jgi:cytochrome c551/c552